MTENREQGVDFGDLQDDLEAEEYPLSEAELLEEYGDREVEYANGSETLRSLLEPLGQSSYGSADEVHQSVLNMVGEEAEGRKGYTDRSTDATDEDYEQQSF